MRTYAHYRRLSILCAPLVALMLLLTACGSGSGQPIGNGDQMPHLIGNQQESTLPSTATATPKSQSAHTSATTASSATAGSGGGAPSTPAGFKTYQASYLGVSFSIAYPPDWTISPNTSEHATFIEGAAGSFAVQVSPKPYTPSQTVQMGIANTKQGASSSQIVSMPSTTTVNGVTWSQGGVIVNKSSGPLELVIMATRTSHLIILMYDGSPQSFNTLNQNVYQPMVQSFSMA
jgi:hypothetical protein